MTTGNELDASIDREREARMNVPNPTDEALIAAFPALADVTYDEVEALGPHGPVPLRLYRPPTRRSSSAGLVWFHGGAFMGGDLAMPESHWVALALAAAGVTVVAGDYRKALDGVCFPVPVDDVLAVWRWAVDEGSTRSGVAQTAFHIGGGSAGAALAANAAAVLRDRGEALPASLVLAYGTFHPEPVPASAELSARLATLADQRTMPDAIKRQINLRYAGSEEAMRHPHAFAGNGDLVGFPPTYLLNAEFDILRASGQRFAGQLADAAVTVRCEFEPGASHGHLNTPFVPEARRSIDRIVAWIDQVRSPSDAAAP